MKVDETKKTAKVHELKSNTKKPVAPTAQGKYMKLKDQQLKEVVENETVKEALHYYYAQNVVYAAMASRLHRERMLLLGLAGKKHSEMSKEEKAVVEEAINAAYRKLGYDVEVGVHPDRVLLDKMNELKEYIAELAIPVLGIELTEEMDEDILKRSLGDLVVQYGAASVTQGKVSEILNQRASGNNKDSDVDKSVDSIEAPPEKRSDAPEKELPN